MWLKHFLNLNEKVRVKIACLLSSVCISGDSLVRKVWFSSGSSLEHILFAFVANAGCRLCLMKVRKIVVSKAKPHSHNVQLYPLPLCVNLVSLVATTRNAEPPISTLLWTWPRWWSVCVCFCFPREPWGGEVSQLGMSPSLNGLPFSSATHCFYKFGFCFFSLPSYQVIHRPDLPMWCWKL